MKVKCDAVSLYHACQVAGNFVTKRGTLPVLACIELSAGGGNVSLRATDLEKMVILDQPGEVAEEGKIVVEPRRLQRFLKYEKGQVLVENSGFAVTVSGDSEQSVLRLQAFDREFPPVKIVDGGEYDVGPDLIDHLRRAWMFAASEDSRPVLTAVFVNTDANGQTGVAAVDGFELFVAKFKTGLPGGKLLIPAEVCRLVGRLMKGKQVKLAVKEGDSVAFSAPGIRIISQQVKGNFPDYEQLVPKGEPAWRITCSGPVLQSRVEQGSVEDLPTLRLTPKDEALKLTIKEGDVDFFTALVPAKMSGDGKVALNPQYVAKFSKMFAELTIDVMASSSPVAIRGDLEGVVVVVMPMYVQWE